MLTIFKIPKICGAPFDTFDYISPTIEIYFLTHDMYQLQFYIKTPICKFLFKINYESHLRKFFTTYISGWMAILTPRFVIIIPMLMNGLDWNIFPICNISFIVFEVTNGANKFSLPMTECCYCYQLIAHEKCASDNFWATKPSKC